MKPSTTPQEIDDASRLPEADALANSDALTPRGGFMARPGMKAPPTHAVVVRSGDVPLSDDIPLGRPSVPPSARSSVPPAANRREQDTQKAVPKPGYRPALPIRALADAGIPKSAPPGTSVESSPPPSDGPVVASVPAPALAKHRRGRLPNWTIAAAAAAGLIVGLGSVATSLRLGRSTAAAASPAAAQPVVQALARSSLAQAPSAPQLSRPKPEPRTPINAARSAEPSRTAASASTRGVAVPPARRTIF